MEQSTEVPERITPWHRDPNAYDPAARMCSFRLYGRTFTAHSAHADDPDSWPITVREAPSGRYVATVGSWGRMAQQLDERADIRPPAVASQRLIKEVGWKLGKEITEEAYRSDLRYAEGLAFPVHEWEGTDREGKPLTVSWIPSPSGALLSAYEITGR